jgi:hypothetical protein
VKTRLIVSYGEASLLRGAGWEQAVGDGMTYYQEEPYDNVLHAYRGSESLQRLAEREIAAPRLDELLAFLWEHEMKFDPTLFENYGGKPRLTIYSIARAEWGPVTDPLNQHEFNADDHLGAVVAAVLYVLKEYGVDTASQE